MSRIRQKGYWFESMVCSFPHDLNATDVSQQQLLSLRRSKHFLLKGRQAVPWRSPLFGIHGVVFVQARVRSISWQCRQWFSWRSRLVLFQATTNFVPSSAPAQVARNQGGIFGRTDLTRSELSGPFWCVWHRARWRLSIRTLLVSVWVSVSRPWALRVFREWEWWLEKKNWNYANVSKQALDAVKRPQGWLAKAERQPRKTCSTIRGTIRGRRWVGVRAIWFQSLAWFDGIALPCYDFL